MSAVIHLDSRRPVVPAPGAPTAAPVDRILRVGTVAQRVGLSRATLYRRIAKGQFPAQVDLGGISVGWRESDVAAWIASRGKGGGK